MRYQGVICAGCGDAFHENDEVVVCPRCGTPAHKSCWARTGACPNEDKHEEGFVWQKDRSLQAPANEAPAGNPAAQGHSPFAGAVNEGQGAKAPCSVCGTLNDFGEPVCVRCGERLYWSRNDGNAYDPRNSSPFGHKGFHYGYAQSQFEIDGIPASEVAAYVQQNAEGYLTKFLYMDNRGTKNSFNWVAAFFPYLWLLSRKLYKTGLLVMAGFLLCSVLTMFNRTEIESNRALAEIVREYSDKKITLQEAQDAIYALPVAQPDALYYASLVLRLALSLFVAFQGDALYRKKMVRDIHAARESAQDSETYFALLSKKGGISLGAALGGFVALQALVFVLSQVIASLFF